MTTLHLDPTSMPEIARQVAQVAFPDYKGRKFELRVEPTVSPQSYWDGGSRTYWAFVRLADMAVLSIETIHPTFHGRVGEVAIPEGIVAVSHHIFCGKDMGIRFHVAQPDLLPMPTAEVTPDQEIVLVYTKSFKPSYNGISNFRFHEANRYKGITAELWAQAKAECIEKGWLNKAGAITPNGRNAVEQSKLRPY